MRADAGDPTFLQVAAAGGPKLVKAYLELGKCYLALGKPEEALQVLLRVTELEPNSKEPHYLMARAYGLLNNDEERKRQLLRLWLAPEEARPLPVVYAERYGSVVPGQRGGIVVHGTRYTIPWQAEDVLRV